MIEPRLQHPFAWTSYPWGRALRCEGLRAVAPHFFTTRDLTLRGPASEHGWRNVAVAIGVEPARLVRLKQVHGTAIVVIRASGATGDGVLANPGDDPARADIVMTDDPRVALSVQVADCVPLLLGDARTGAVAAVHAGWRGTAARAAGHAVAAMHSAFGVNPVDLLAAIGPSIGPCCYQVGGDVLEAFRAAAFSEASLSDWFRPDDGGHRDRYRLDVARANADQLRAAGLDAHNIMTCGLCTACAPHLFPSYRRDGAGTGRLAGVIRSGARPAPDPA